MTVLLLVHINTVPYISTGMPNETVNMLLLLFSTYSLQPSRLIVRSGLDVPNFATRRLHTCHQARAPSGGKWNYGKEMSGKFV
jgi:hypothetical protein